MAQPVHRGFRRFLIALLVGGILGAIVGTFIKSGGTLLLPPKSSDKTGENSAESSESTPGTVESSVAWRYVEAYREGNWEQVLELTPWAQERLQYVKEADGIEAMAAERDTILAGFASRTLDENYLRDTGVDDQYVFTPGATVSFVSFDEGRDDLEAPVARRTWFKVVYSLREKALLDGDSIPIRSLRVGVNVSREGLVLKANIIGNLDIDWSSITYDWPSP